MASSCYELLLITMARSYRPNVLDFRIVPLSLKLLFGSTYSASAPKLVFEYRICYAAWFKTLGLTRESLEPTRMYILSRLRFEELTETLRGSCLFSPE